MQSNFLKVFWLILIYLFFKPLKTTFADNKKSIAFLYFKGVLKTKITCFFRFHFVCFLSPDTTLKVNSRAGAD